MKRRKSKVRSSSYSMNHDCSKKCDRCQECKHSIRDHDNETWACKKCDCGIYIFPVSHNKGAMAYVVPV